MELRQRLTSKHRVLDLGGMERDACAAAEYLCITQAR
jgi:hypothetical protein